MAIYFFSVKTLIIFDQITSGFIHLHWRDKTVHWCFSRFLFQFTQITRSDSSNTRPPLKGAMKILHSALGPMEFCELISAFWLLHSQKENDQRKPICPDLRSASIPVEGVLCRWNSKDSPQGEPHLMESQQPEIFRGVEEHCGPTGDKESTFPLLLCVTASLVQAYNLQIHTSILYLCKCLSEPLPTKASLSTKPLTHFSAAPSGGIPLSPFLILLCRLMPCQNFYFPDTRSKHL